MKIFSSAYIPTNSSPEQKKIGQIEVRTSSHVEEQEIWDIKCSSQSLLSMLKSLAFKGGPFSRKPIMTHNAKKYDHSRKN